MILKRIRNNIKAYNKYMTDKYLDELSSMSLLRLTHPADRIDFATGMKELGFITKEELDKLRINHEWKKLTY